MALASWLRGVRIPKGDTKPGKVQHFGANFEGTLILESGVLRPYGQTRGRLCIETRFMLKFTGIHVQLEAEHYLKFSSQNGRHCYRKRTCIFENTLTLESGDQLSPYRVDVVPSVSEGKDLIVVLILPESCPTPASPSYTCPVPPNSSPPPSSPPTAPSPNAS